jgi:hypothetical protein
MMTLCVWAATAAADPAKLELVDGQYRVTAGTYTAVVPPTGLISSLSLGSAVFLNQPLVINTGNAWNVPAEHSCATITQPSPESLMCEGSKVRLTYTFKQDSFDLDITAKGEKVSVFANLHEEIEGFLAQSNNERWGRQVSVGGEPLQAYCLTECLVYKGGQILRVAGMQMAYGPPYILRLELPAGATVKARFEARPATADDLAVFSIPALYTAPLTVLSPLDYQVFQRQTAKEGRVRIAGRTTVPCDAIQFRRGDGEWQDIARDPVTGDFAATLVLPAGGWYRCGLRAMKAGKEIGSKVIEHVGVGEVFVGAGQSNSTNSGEERQKTASGLVATFSGRIWRLADDPQPGVHDGSNLGSFWPAFGDAMAARYKVPIGVAVTGHGATRVEQWQPGGDLFSWLQGRILQLGPQGFRMVLWHQGESDCATPPVEYADRLRTIIEQGNARAGWSLPWMVARVGATKGQDLLISQHAALEGPYTDPLKGEYRGRNGADVHFSAKGLQKHGELWAEKVGAYLDSVLVVATEAQP